MSAKLVTSNQSDSVRSMANDKGVTREQFQNALDDGSFARFLDSLKENTEKVKPNEDICTHTVHVRVKQDRDWQEAVNAAGPDTPDDYNVRKVGDQYPPQAGEIEGDYVLLNYPGGDGSWDKALAWGKSQGLKLTNPREAFAVGEQHPKLHNQLGMNPMYVVATRECAFEGDRHACDVWWHGTDREANLLWVGSYGYGIDWFLFRK